MENIINLAIGFLGVIAYCLIKANSLQQDAQALKVTFTLKDYFAKDYLMIGLSFVAVILWVFLFGEVVTIYPKIENIVRLTFCGMGLTGSFALQLFFGKSKKYLRTLMGEQSDQIENSKN